jgi:drug/metabolite transporter (DMT)-like permease
MIFRRLRMAPIRRAGLSRRTFPEQIAALPAESKSHTPLRWLNNQPYLLLSLTALFWAGNIVLARYVAGHVPPLTLSCIRWIGVFLILLPFACPHLQRDWPALRASLPLMLVLSATGFAFNNAISYWAMQYTEALNALLIQSSGPLFVALWSLIGPNRAAPFLHLVPVFGSAMAILLLGEALRPFHLAGYVLVLAGVIIASRQGSASSPTKA